jgi:hypothetical protein
MQMSPLRGWEHYKLRRNPKPAGLMVYLLSYGFSKANRSFRQNHPLSAGKGVLQNETEVLQKEMRALHFVFCLLSGVFRHSTSELKGSASEFRAMTNEIEPSANEKNTPV